MAFSVQTENKKPVAETKNEITPQNPEINYVDEIRDAIIPYDSLLSSGIQESGTVGAAAVIIYKNQVAFLKCYGVKKVGTADSINKNTIFRLASVSKSIRSVSFLSINKFKK